MLRVNRKAKPPQAVGLIQPMFSQRLHHIKTQDLYFYLILRLRSHSQNVTVVVVNHGHEL